MNPREIERRAATGEYGEEARLLTAEWEAVPPWRVVRRRVLGQRIFRIVYPQTMHVRSTEPPDQAVEETS